MKTRYYKEKGVGHYSIDFSEDELLEENTFAMGLALALWPIVYGLGDTPEMFLKKMRDAFKQFDEEERTE